MSISFIKVYYFISLAVLDFHCGARASFLYLQKGGLLFTARKGFSMVPGRGRQRLGLPDSRRRLSGCSA